MKKETSHCTVLFYRPGSIQLISYFIAETLLTGSMFLFMMKQFHLIGSYDFLFVPFIMIAYVCQIRPLLWIGAFMSLVIFLTGTWLGGHFTENFLYITINTSLFYMIGFCLGRVTVLNNKKKLLIESIQEKNKALKQYSKRIEELTIMEERNRVSQDLHDTVGHIFTSVITSLDALPFLIKNGEAENSIKEISSLARKGLADVRKTIHQLSPLEAHQSLSRSFHQVIDEFTKHTGTSVDFLIEGYERELGERTKYTCIRCLQEGLTNAKRHGQATKISVKISYHEQELILRIKDNGIGTDSLHLGFGLQTMNDRITSLSGSLRIESDKNEGSEVLCSIPLSNYLKLKP
ncbi:sensor histidine kinase [Bacillus sp. OK048]|uniref:sensor histidine kinase n=1 Tax=Bacillus sp. OK048 TaxID=1882761 RepID=UPI0015878D7C|nr:sensor histidine kinase [Bacillus sp. OK048]